MWQGSYEFDVNQWGVGHGGFHSQSIFFQALDRDPTAVIGNGSVVRVIYDCGSGRDSGLRRALADAITRMLSVVPDRSTIDLLVISHFDQDHVNGLGYLAAELKRKRVHVARVWAPILTKIEALFAISSSALTGRARREYVALVTDPVGRLSDLFGDADITPITRDDEPIPLSPIGERADDTNGDLGGNIVLATAPGGRGLVANSHGPRTSEALWEIQPYVIESALIGSASASASVRKLLGKPAEDISVAELVTLANNPTVLAEFHSAVHKHHKGLGRGKGTSSARTGPNLSSLCVYSGPVSPYRWCHFRRGWAPVAVTPHAIPIAPAWLGTGDAGLLRSHHVDALRTALTQSRLDRIGITSAPHHGSKHDSGGPLWDALPNLSWVTIEAKHATGGTGNRHPHAPVVTELKARQLDVHFAQAGKDFCWKDKRIR